MANAQTITRTARVARDSSGDPVARARQMPATASRPSDRPRTITSGTAGEEFGRLAALAATTVATIRPAPASAAQPAKGAGSATAIQATASATVGPRGRRPSATSAATSGASGSASTSPITHPAGEVMTQATAAAQKQQRFDRRIAGGAQSPRDHREPADRQQEWNARAGRRRRVGRQQARQAGRRRHVTDGGSVESAVEASGSVVARPAGAVIGRVEARRRQQHLLGSPFAVEGGARENVAHVFAEARRTVDERREAEQRCPDSERRQRRPTPSRGPDHRQEAGERRFEGGGRRQRRARQPGARPFAPGERQQEKDQEIDLAALEVAIEGEEERAGQEEDEAHRAGLPGSRRRSTSTPAATQAPSIAAVKRPFAAANRSDASGRNRSATSGG